MAGAMLPLGFSPFSPGTNPVHSWVSGAQAWAEAVCAGMHIPPAGCLEWHSMAQLQGPPGCAQDCSHRNASFWQFPLGISLL